MLVILADRRVYNVYVCMCLYVQQVSFIVNMYVCMSFRIFRFRVYLLGMFSLFCDAVVCLVMYVCMRYVLYN